MKKLKLMITSLCLVATLTLAVPTTAYADESGPQGGSNSTTTQPPPPPPPPSEKVLALIEFLVRLLSKI